MLSGFGYRCVYRSYKAGKPDSAISLLSARLGRHKMGCNFQEYNKWKVKGAWWGGALAAEEEGDGMGGCTLAALQPFCGYFGVQLAFCANNSLARYYTQQDQREAGWENPWLSSSNSPWPRGRPRCQDVSAHPSARWCFPASPSLLPKASQYNSLGRTAALEHHCAQKEGGSFKHQPGPKSLLGSKIRFCPSD